MGILDGKTILVTGVITDASIAFAAARIAQEQGAQVILTGFGRLSLVKRIANKLPAPAPVIELNVTNSDQLSMLVHKVFEHADYLDGVVHSVAFAPQSCLGGGFMTAPASDVLTALHVSAVSLKSLAAACLPLMTAGGSIVGLTFDSTQAYPDYDWMGVAKSALESTNRYLAKELGPQGIRSNLVAAGPLNTLAARSIGKNGRGYNSVADIWGKAPLTWDFQDTTPAGKAVVALLSDWFPATTGEIIHADGGVHAVRS